MPKQSRREVDCSATTDVVTQIACALRRPEAALIGAGVGALVPWFAQTLAHEEIPASWTADRRGLAIAMIMIVVGCALFSALTVYKFGHAVFGDPRKAIGFTLALEGVMLVSHGPTSTIALAVLIAINAVGNGAAIALARDATCRRAEADARRAATRRDRRAGSRPAPALRPAADPQPRTAGIPGLIKVPTWESVSEELCS